MEMGGPSLMSLAMHAQGVRSRRWSSYDRTGGNADNWPIPAGQTVVLGETDRPGCIRHIWMTTAERDHNLRALVLRIYWDGQESPSVASPVGDFFGLGHAKANYWQSMPLQAFYLGLNCWFPMPFARGCRVTVTNDSPNDSFLYFYVDWQEWDEAPVDMGRFHCLWKRELVTRQSLPVGPNSRGSQQALNTDGSTNFVVLDTDGRGHYVGSCLHLDTNETGWWGEGDDMFFIDGEPWPPRLHGTGTEDYYCGAWNYNQLSQPWCAPYFGYSFKGNADYTGKHSQYRFHIEDPVYFERSLRFSIEHGHANDRQGDWTCTAYWYASGRTIPLPEIPPFEQRIPYAFGGLERWPGKDRHGLPY